MISRTWHGLVPKEHARGFEIYLNRTGIREAREIDGNVAVYSISIAQGQYTHFFLCTIWSTWEAIVSYAGNDPAMAITYPEDENYGLLSDPIVLHQKVNTSDNPFSTVERPETN